MDICARDSIWNTPMVSAAADHVVDGVVLASGLSSMCSGRADRAASTRSKAAADRGEHAQRQHVDLEQAQLIEIVLVPLDHRALGHGGVFDRHQLAQRPSEITKPPTCCDRCRGKPTSCRGQLRPACATGSLSGSTPACAQALRLGQVPVSAACTFLASASTASAIQVQRLPTSRTRAARLVGDDGRRPAPRVRGRTCRRCTGSPPRAARARSRCRCPAARRARATRSARTAVDMRSGSDGGDLQAIADRGIGRRTAALAEDSRAAREGARCRTPSERTARSRSSAIRCNSCSRCAHRVRARRAASAARPSSVRRAGSWRAFRRAARSRGIFIAQLVETERAAFGDASVSASSCCG